MEYLELLKGFDIFGIGLAIILIWCFIYGVFGATYELILFIRDIIIDIKKEIR